jgi:nucleoside-diphosphate-sugar epimerase
MERVLVTGATGFTGTHLVRQLAESGCDVRVIARDAERARARLPAGTDVVHGDITDPAVVRRAVRGRETVYHLAAAFREAAIPDRRYYEVHVEATRELLEAARAEGIRRFLHCSTVGVHSHVANPPADESWPYTPDDVYQRTKAEGEQLALRFQREHGFPLTVVRPGPIYGPGDMRLLKLFRAVARRRFAMIGSGEVYFQMVHVEDLARGMRLAAAHDAAVGEVFILTGDEAVTLNELVGRIARIYGVPRPRLRLPAWPFFAAAAVCEAVCVPLGVEPPLYRRRVAFFTKSRAFSIEKAKRVLGYRPEVSLAEGLAETAEWYRTHGHL